MGFSVRLPEWIRARNLMKRNNTKRILRKYALSSVCEEARCPNRGDCFLKPAAAFMIMGSKCTRKCGFCSVRSELPETLDPREPERVARASREMGLRYVVITSVTRDDLNDGGARHFAASIAAVRKHLPAAKVEVLTPDFQGVRESIGVVTRCSPDVFNHNIETVPRLYPMVRPQANYRRSLSLLSYVKKNAPDLLLKSGIMLGLGERLHEVREVLKDLRAAGCDIITIGQYLRPSKSNLPVAEYLIPEIFEELRFWALSRGFRHVLSGPMVRSSMNAEDVYNKGGSNISGQGKA